MVDTKKLSIDEKVLEVKETKEKLDFVYEMYEDSKKERVRLQNQILSSNDSFGKIYGVIKQLEDLEPDKIYQSAIGVLEEILDVKDVFIYFVTQNRYYLRLISQSLDTKLNLKKSVHIKDSEVLMRILEERTIFVNKRMDPDLPKIIVPIGNNESIFAFIYIHEVKFKHLSNYHMNLIKIVSNLITVSIQRAYQYNEVMERETHVENTVFMKNSYFLKYLSEKLEQTTTQSTLLAIERGEQTLEDLDAFLRVQLREFDVCGHIGDQLYVLLSNASPEEAQHVIARFKKSNIISRPIERESIYDLLA
jgi:hypothetical protein